MRYMLMLYADEKAGAQIPPDQMQKAMETLSAYQQALTKAGAFVLTAPLARTADAKTPAPVLLAVLRANLTISPVSINYSPSTKKFEVLLTLSNEGLTPAKLRTALNQFDRGVKEALAAIDKATAIEKEKAEGEKS